MLQFQRGSIVWARPPTGRGGQKCCPLVLVSEMTVQPPTYLGVAVTTKFTEPLENDEVKLPWNVDHLKVRTRLTKPCVAKCSWLSEIEAAAVDSMAGVVPAEQMQAILERLPRD